VLGLGQRGTGARVAYRMRSREMCRTDPCVACLCVQEVNACVNQGIVFTLEESGDGWDDVRRSVVDAKKQRASAVIELKEKYGPGLASAGRWAKVITNEVVKVSE